MDMQLKASVSAIAILFAASSGTLAADLSRPAPVPYKAPPPMPAFSWTGFYIGANIGGAFATGSVTDNLFGLSASTSHTGFIGGGQAGFNYQFNYFVIGVEGDFDGTSLRATGPGVATAIGVLQGSANTDWVSTLAARFGVAFDRVLLYGKVGGGWVQNTASITNLTTGGAISRSNTNDGFVAGGGIEWAFAPNWSTKFEYTFLDLNSFNFTGPGFVADTFILHRNIEMFKAGVNYRFNWY
jgi:outer membrane immunogenic protein